MLKAIIVDDEQHCIDRLDMLLKGHSETVQVIKCCNTISEGQKEIESLKPDVVFLDIQLNDDLGFDLLSRLKHIDFEVIFTTAFDSYAIKAFKFSALDYLLKPIAEDDLGNAIQRLLEQERLKDSSQKIEVLFHNFKKEIGQSKRLAIPTLNGLLMVGTDKIVRMQSDTNYTHIFMSSGKKITTPRTLKYFEELLDSAGFFRLHKSHFVNLSFVDSYLKGKRGYVILSDNTKLEVAVRRKELLLEKLHSN